MVLLLNTGSAFAVLRPSYPHKPVAPYHSAAIVLDELKRLK